MVQIYAKRNPEKQFPQANQGLIIELLIWHEYTIDRFFVFVLQE